VRHVEICPKLGPESKERGIIFVGITSATGLQELARFDNIHLARNIWDTIEGRR